MHVIAGELTNMKRAKRAPKLLLIPLARPTMGRRVDLHQVRLRATEWLLDQFEDPEPAIRVHIELSPDGDRIVTSMGEDILRRINDCLNEHLQGKDVRWRFTGFDREGYPTYHWRPR